MTSRWTLYVACCALARADLSCWFGGAYSREQCCDISKGPRGDEQCWGDGFTFDFCCAQEALCLSSAALDHKYHTVTMRDFLPNVRPVLCLTAGGSLAVVSARLTSASSDKEVNASYLECIPPACETDVSHIEAAAYMGKVRKDSISRSKIEVLAVHRRRALTSNGTAGTLDDHRGDVKFAVGAIILLAYACLVAVRADPWALLLPSKRRGCTASVVRVLLTLYAAFGHAVVVVDWDPRPLEVMVYSGYRPWWLSAAIFLSSANIGFAVLSAYLAASATCSCVSDLARGVLMSWARMAAYCVLSNWFLVYVMASREDWTANIGGRSEVGHFNFNTEHAKTAKDLGVGHLWLTSGLLLVSKIGGPWRMLFLLQSICSFLTLIRRRSEGLGMVLTASSAAWAWAHASGPDDLIGNAVGRRELLIPGFVAYGHQAVGQFLASRGERGEMAWLLCRGSHMALAVALVACWPSKSLVAGASAGWLALQAAESLERRAAGQLAASGAEPAAIAVLQAADRLCMGVNFFSVDVMAFVQASVLHHVPVNGSPLIMLEHCTFLVLLSFLVAMVCLVFVQGPLEVAVSTLFS